MQQVQTGRTQQGRLEENWSTPANVQRRETDIGRHESPRAPPPAPPPTDERLVTDWSSIDSPRERISQLDNIAGNAKSNINQTDNQTEQPGSETVRSETRGNTLGDIVTLLSTHRQLSQEDARPNDREVMRSDIEVRTQREEPGMNIVSNNGVRDTQILSFQSGLHEIEIIIGGSPIRTLIRDMIPQLDGPASVCTTGRALENVRNEKEIT